MNTIAAICMILGSIGFWFAGYMRGLEIGKVRGRIEYRTIERWKRESQ